MSGRVQWQRNRQLMLWVGCVCLGIGLVLWGARQSLNTFVTPEMLLSHTDKKQWHARLGGHVVANSVRWDQSQQQWLFRVGYPGSHVQLNVSYRGALPALFAEGKAMLADGMYDPQHKVYIAHRIYAKHDENYTASVHHDKQTNSQQEIISDSHDNNKWGVAKKKVRKRVPIHKQVKQVASQGSIPSACRQKKAISEHNDPVLARCSQNSKKIKSIISNIKSLSVSTISMNHDHEKQSAHSMNHHDPRSIPHEAMH